MGLSKAAELNHYPGPLHILNLKVELELTKGQIEETQSIYGTMHSNAKKYGRSLIDKEREIELLFSNQQADPKVLEELVKEAAELKAKIRLEHLSAHISQKLLLSETQIKKYDEARGYTGAGNHKRKHHHNH